MPIWSCITFAPTSSPPLIILNSFPFSFFYYWYHYPFFWYFWQTLPSQYPVTHYPRSLLHFLVLHPSIIPKNSIKYFFNSNISISWSFFFSPLSLFTTFHTSCSVAISFCLLLKSFIFLLFFHCMTHCTLFFLSLVIFYSSLPVSAFSQLLSQILFLLIIFLISATFFSRFTDLFLNCIL